MDQRKKNISRLKTISQNSISQILGVFSVLILSLVIVKFHSVELWGEYAELLIWSNFILLFLGFGHYDKLLRSFSDSPSTIDQQWTNNILARSILLIPSFILIYFIPLFNGFEYLIILYILIQFLSHSFKVFIMYHRKFVFNIWVESLLNIGLIVSVLYFLKQLDLELLLTILIIAYGFKVLCYGIYFIKGFKGIAIRLQLSQLKYSIPFFIPIAVGTVRVKIDAYYGTHFFSVSDLSKYQIFLSFLILAQMVSSFALTPYIKNFYRAKDSMIIDLQGRFFKFGWIYAIFMGMMMFIALSMIYELTFTFYQYLLGTLFMIPLFLHILLISEYYKKNLQTKIAFFAFIIVVIQIISGYFLISYWSINGALILKVLGQWGIVIILWLWIRKRRVHE